MSSQTPELLVGADPEFFVHRNGHIVSGHTYECGSKDDPKPTSYAWIQNDGMLVECNIRPSATREEFVMNTRYAMADLIDHLKKSDKKADIKVVPAHKFNKKVFRGLPEFVTRLGCEPDYNAYTGLANPSPDAATNLRTASGHIHLGWTKDANPRSIEHMEFCCALVKQLDFYIGLPSLIWDPDNTRRKLYGKAGAFRPKPYGLEYRVPSNVWTKNDKIVAFVFDRTVAAYRDFKKGIILHDKYKEIARSLIDVGGNNWHKGRPELKKDVLTWG